MIRWREGMRGSWLGKTAIGNEADAQALAGLQLARLVDIVTDELNVLHRRGDVGILAPGAVSHGDQIAVVCYTSNWRVSAIEQMRDDAHTASCSQARRVGRCKNSAAEQGKRKGVARQLPRADFETLSPGGRGRGGSIRV
jgi:hypothetical protein